MQSVSAGRSVQSAAENRATTCLGDRCFLVASLCLVLASPIRKLWASAGDRGEGKVRTSIISLITVAGCNVFCLTYSGDRLGLLFVEA